MDNSNYGARGVKKAAEQHLIELRRLDVAKMYYRGKSVKEIAASMNLDSRVIYYDIDYIRYHENELMSKLIVKTVPHIINKALSRLDQANEEAWSIIENKDNNLRDRIAALAVVDKTARNIVDIVTNNKSIVDTALGNTIISVELQQQRQRQRRQELEEDDKKNSDNNNNELSTEETRTTSGSEDGNRVF